MILVIVWPLQQLACSEAQLANEVPGVTRKRPVIRNSSVGVQNGLHHTVSKR